MVAADTACQSIPYHSVVEQTLVDGFIQLADHLPAPYLVSLQELQSQADSRGAYLTTSPTIPLYEAFDDCGKAIYDFMLRLCYTPEIKERDLISEIRQTIWKNECQMNHLSAYERRRTEVPEPYERDEPREKLCWLYFKDTPFLELFTETRIPFRIERERFNEHGAIFARSGHGKTQALRSFVAQFLQEDDPPALFLIDSLGSLIEGIDQLEVFNTTLRDRLIILDPTRPEYMPRLNLFTGIQSDELVFYLFKAIDQSFTQRQATMASYLMEYMRIVPSPDLFKLVELCKAKENPYPQLLPKLSRFARLFFEQEFFVSGKGADPFVAQTKAQIAQRLFTLGRMPKFNEMFTATGNVFDPFEHMQNGSVVLINTDARSPRVGGLGPEGSAIFGRYILAQCLEAARLRPKRERELVLIVLDEAKAYMDEQAALILSDARQFGMGMLLASQQPHQLPEGVRREINTNTSIRMMGNIEYAIAAQYARDMFCEPEFILNTKKYDGSHAEWATYVSGMDRAVKVNIPYGAIERMPWLAAPLTLAPSSKALTPKVEKRLRPRMVVDALDTYQDLQQYLEENEPELDVQEYADFMHDEIMRAITAGDWPEENEKLPDDQNRKGTTVPGSVIKPGKKWD
jgi:hypothetical protein